MQPFHEATITHEPFVALYWATPSTITHDSLQHVHLFLSHFPFLTNVSILISPCLHCRALQTIIPCTPIAPSKNTMHAYSTSFTTPYLVTTPEHQSIGSTQLHFHVHSLMCLLCLSPISNSTSLTTRMVS